MKVQGKWIRLLLVDRSLAPMHREITKVEEVGPINSREAFTPSARPFPSFFLAIAGAVAAKLASIIAER